MSYPPLNLKYHPNPILKVQCQPCTLSDPEIDMIGKEMIKIMFANNGYGLSAPQVGLSHNIFVMRDSEAANKGLVFVNPTIVETSSEQINDWEGCLSLPEQRVKISRSASIEVEFDVPLGHTLPIGDDRITWRFEGMNARCVQHEIDHLNGIMIYDHIESDLARKLFLQRHAKKMSKRDKL